VQRPPARWLAPGHCQWAGLAFVEHKTGKQAGPCCLGAAFRRNLPKGVEQWRIVPELKPDGGEPLPGRTAATVETKDVNFGDAS
jgi:hypothetical protein